MKYHPMPCKDCGEDTNHKLDEYYMVHNEIWMKAVGTNDRLKAPMFLCIGCLEKRLGRTLTKEDFTEALVNRIKSSSKRLEQRRGLTHNLDY